MSFIPPSHLGTTMERFEVGRKIGQGSYGSVFLVRRRSDSAVMVMKELFIDNIAEKEQAAFFKEAELMERLSHPSVVGYKEWYVDNEAGALCIVMHYCERGDLTKVIKNRKRTCFFFCITNHVKITSSICIILFCSNACLDFALTCPHRLLDL